MTKKIINHYQTVKKCIMMYFVNLCFLQRNQNPSYNTFFS
ncbi:hypothetical protein EUBHAL_00849 [Anaerobutyricum hallii DSM 3353]|uniref:Uncharacterized protein n=1 Tax=Anaerobutyricum hallii DSM 3353 TaxID=411469 RepID=C0ETW6_9FIRM|nr:hypothetical protein EUBHAL_00849 [Anaerobutyricum hallii DSM 3353]